MVIQKTFCICCNDRKEKQDKHDNDYERDCRKRDDWRDHDKKAQCFVDTHKIGEANNFLDVIVASGSVPTPIFQDDTKNHNKTFISLSNLGNQPGNDVMITITSRGKKCCNRPITETIPNQGTRIFQVEDFESLVATSVSGTTLGTVIQKTFCICCNDGKDKKDDKHDCCCD